MKSLITILLLTVVGFSVYPTVSNAYTEAMQAKAAINTQAKSLCKNTNTKWVKVEGSLKVYQCKDL